MTCRGAADPPGVTLYVGPMWAGKTSTMRNKLLEFASAETPALMVVPAGGRPPRAPLGSPHVSVQAVTFLRDARTTDERGRPYRVIGVDEGQFFPDLELCDRWAAGGSNVIVAALDSDFRRAAFAPVAALLPRCDRVIKMAGLCSACRQRPSVFTRRRPGHGTGEQYLPGDEHYECVCRACYSQN